MLASAMPSAGKLERKFNLSKEEQRMKPDSERMKGGGL
jgi:hypothetical protein